METNELPESEAGQQKPSVNTNQKILADLDLLLEKMDRCDSYLRPNGCLVESPVFKSEELLDVIGFLEACSPRMVELVEAATQGALSEQVLEKCLLVNDRLTTTLSDIDCIELTDKSPDVAASSSDDAFDAFLSERIEKPGSGV